MITNLKNTDVQITIGNNTYLITLFNLSIALYLLAAFSCVVSALFGVFLTGIMGIIAIISGPLLTFYLAYEFRAILIPIFVERLCKQSEDNLDTNRAVVAEPEAKATVDVKKDTTNIAD
ncbi:hypothetical protein [Pseudoalteromonas prydzensis]|uniref:hypothetical protein n=1 Tax=Pseudoalteromonas prydzensis TaxID=182141 RepID=UPI003FD4A7B1